MRQSIICLFCFFSVLCVVPAHAQSYRIAYIYDGDTLRLENGQVVRLAGIDAPEMAREGKPGQYGSREARELATRLAQGKLITLRGVDKNWIPRDRYQRLVAEVILPDKSSLNEYLVAQGVAFVYVHEHMDKAYIQRLWAQQKTALREKRGLWRGLLAMDVAHKPYVGNARSQRFFVADCPEVGRIQQRNRVAFDSLQAAFEAGFAPGRGACPLWPEE